MLTPDRLDNIAKKVAADTNPLDGMDKAKASKFVNRIMDKHTKGFFSDDTWAPVKRIFSDLLSAGVNGVITSTEYGKDDKGVPNSKTWKFEVEFNNNRGKPTKLYGIVRASGAGSVDDVLGTYDLVAYAS